MTDNQNQNKDIETQETNIEENTSKISNVVQEAYSKAYSILDETPDDDVSSPVVDSKHNEYNPAVNENVNLDMPYSAISSNQPLNLATEGVPFLAERNSDEVENRVNDLFTATKKKSTYDYAITYELAKKVSSLTGDMFNASIDRSGSTWNQFLNTGVGKVGYMAPKIAEDGVSKVGGKKALLRVRSLMGKGTLTQIPLFRSGFWITIKAPSESAQIELNRRIGEEKIALGRQTHGLIFSNNEAFLTGWLVDFIIEHIYDTTLKNAEDIKSKIKISDIPVLVWGLALSIYPRGFKYTRALTDPEGIRKKELVTSLINISKLLWVDNSYLSDAHRAQMTMRQPDSVSQEMLDTYQNTIRHGIGRRVSISEGVDIILKEPTVAESVDATHRWINDLTNVIDATFTQNEPDDHNRNKMVATHAKASQARAFSSWIEKVIVEDSMDIVEAEDIDEYLELLSEDTELTSKFVEEVKKFINDIAVAVIAIPEASGQVDEKLQRFPQLIPINVQSVFFILLVQSVGRITSKTSLV